MTYKSTTDEIAARIETLLDSELRQLKPSMGGWAIGRKMYVSAEVWSAINPPFDASADGDQLIELRATLDSFVANNRTTVAQDPFKKPNYTVLARTDPVEKEVWDFRTMTDRDGVRCLGCFAGHNSFVALTWNYREGMNFPEEVERCHAEWTALFGSIPPFSSARFEDYGSGFVAV